MIFVNYTFENCNFAEEIQEDRTSYHQNGKNKHCLHDSWYNNWPIVGLQTENGYAGWSADMSTLKLNFEPVL